MGPFKEGWILLEGGVIENQEDLPPPARAKLDWEPRISFSAMIREMVAADLDKAARDLICERNGLIRRHHQKERIKGSICGC